MLSRETGLNLAPFLIMANEFNRYSPVPRQCLCRRIDVVFAHSGSITLSSGEGEVTISQGDTLTLSKGMARSFKNASSAATVLYIVRKSKTPSAPSWVN